MRAALPLFGSIPTEISRVNTREMQAHDPDDVIALSLSKMRERAQAAGVRGRLTHIATRRALLPLGPQARAEEIARAIFAAVKQSVRLREDYEICWAARLQGDVDCQSVEFLIDPERLLSMPEPQGDCDDFTMLTCAMLLAAGLGCEMVTIAADRVDPQRFSHVYAVALLPNGRRLAMDTSHGPAPGWESSVAYRKKGWGELRPHPLALQGVAIDEQVLGGRRAGALSYSGSPGMSGGLGQEQDLPAMWGGGDSLWERLAVIGAETGGAIARARYAVPPVGTFIQRPGEIIERPPSAFALRAGAAGLPSWVLVGGGILLLGIIVAGFARRG
jgi:hypothetical protein